MREMNVDFIEQTEEGLVKKNFTTKMKLVDGLEATIQGLESQIANAGKVDSVNGKVGEVILDAYSLPMNSHNPSWTINNEFGRRAFASDVEEIQRELESIGGSVFHDAESNTISEKTPPSQFSTGITLCNQGVRTDFPSIEEFGVSITAVGDNKNHAQIFITTEGVVWGRRSNLNSGWTGRWYNTKNEIDLKADKKDLDELKNAVKTYIEPSNFTGDMDDLTEPGRYYVASSASNKPTSGGWFVDVYVANVQNNGILHKYQVAYKMTGEKSVYVRNQWGGEWTDWQRVDGRNKADKTYVDDELKGKASTGWVTNIRADVMKNKEDIKELFQSGVRINKKLVDNLNSMGISASTSDSIDTNIDKLSNIPTHKDWRGTVTKDGYYVSIPDGIHSNSRVTSRVQGLSADKIPAGTTIGGVTGTLVAHDILSKGKKGRTEFKVGWYNSFEERLILITNNPKQILCDYNDVKGRDLISDPISGLGLRTEYDKDTQILLVSTYDTKPIEMSIKAVW